MKKLVIYLLAIVWLLAPACKSNTIPKKPAKVPEQANWLGGVDGGIWILPKEKIKTGEYLISIYTDAGNLWVEDTFKIEGKCLPQLIDTANIFNLMSSFDGKDIILKIKTPGENYNCRLQGKNNTEQNQKP